MKCKECGDENGEMWGHFDCLLCRSCLVYFEKRIDEICYNIAVKTPLEIKSALPAAERGE